jgi:DnaJ-class molecular chaperone
MKDHFDLNLYLDLEIDKNSTKEEITKKYKELSKTKHPDKGGDIEEFQKIVKAYKILTNIESREEYDKNSVYGNKYDASFELYNFEFSNDNTVYDEVYSKEYEKFKNDLLDIVVNVEDMNSTVKYKKFVQCNYCESTGVDKDGLVSCFLCSGDGKMHNGKNCRLCNGRGMLSDYECDSCEGEGKDYRGNNCFMCKGVGSIKSTPCKHCKGGGRTLKEFSIKTNEKQFVKDGELFVYILRRGGNCSNKDINKIGNLSIIYGKSI